MLFLASTSIYRQALLSRLGVPFQAIAPHFDEAAHARPGQLPDQLVAELALGKAASLVALYPDATILGSDQLVDLQGEVLGKPHTTARAIEQLQLMRGREHRLLTAWALYHGGTWLTGCDVTTLRMRPLSDAEIERYVALDLPLDCAGSYKLEQAGITLFETIASRDQTAIIGLPLLAVSAALRKCGYAIP